MCSKKLCLIVIVIAILGLVSMSFAALIGIIPNHPLIAFDTGGHHDLRCRDKSVVDREFTGSYPFVVHRPSQVHQSHGRS